MAAGRVTISVHVPMDSYQIIQKAIERTGEGWSPFFLAAAEERAARVFATTVEPESAGAAPQS
jgi:uncharacterized protein (DUF1778 family)